MNVAGLLDGLSILASQMIFVMTGVWAHDISTPVEIKANKIDALLRIFVCAQSKLSADF